MKNKKIGIYKYFSSNYYSLISALDKISVSYEISSNFEDLTNFKKIIIPGIGNMKHFFNKIEPFEYSKKINNFIENNGVIYGICLGMQVFLKESEESNAKTVGIVNGKVKELKKSFTSGMNVGFKKINFDKKNTVFKNLFKNINENSKFYFLHKYHCLIDNKVDKMYTNFENNKIVSGMYKKNILGTQFHPELSGLNGLKFLKNFSEHKF